MLSFSLRIAVFIATEQSWPGTPIVDVPSPRFHGLQIIRLVETVLVVNL